MQSLQRLQRPHATVKPAPSTLSWRWLRSVIEAEGEFGMKAFLEFGQHSTPYLETTFCRPGLALFKAFVRVPAAS